MRRFAAQFVLALMGLAAVVWALTVSANPTITCRDVVMTPGTVCPNAQGTLTQTYEQRFSTSQQARPVVAGVGILVAGFGATLAVHTARARRR